MASYHFNEIEFEDECDTDSQCCDLVSLFKLMLTSVSLPNLNPILEPTLIPNPIEFEHKLLILDSQISLLRNECELQFYDLDQTHEPTPTFEPKIDLSFIPKSVSIPISFILKPKPSIR